MKMKKKTFAGVIFIVAFVMMIGISAVALWTNNVMPFDKNDKPAVGIPAISAEDKLLYPATDDNGKWGYINSEGEWIVQAQYDYAELFLDDVAWVKKDGLWGIVSSNGDLIVDCQYTYKYFLDDDLYKIAVAINGNVKSIYNSSGKKIFGVENGLVGEMDGGLIAFSRTVDNVEQWGFADTQGKVIIAPAYKSVGDVGLTHALAQTFDNQMVLVSRKDGSETKLPNNVELHGLGSNLLMYKENNLYGYLDMTGEIAIEPQFTEAAAFSHNAALVKTENGYGLINEDGVFLTEPKNGYGKNVGNGYYLFGTDELSPKTLYDCKGQIITENIINVNSWFNGNLNVQTENATKFVNVESGIIEGVQTANYDNAVYYGNSVAVRDINGISYYDFNGNLLQTYGQTVDIGNNAKMTCYLQNPNAYLEIAYPEVTTSESSLQDKFAVISDRLKENAFSDYDSLYKNNDGSINFMVKGDYEYSVAGNVITVLQRTRFTDYDSDVQYEDLCFDVTTGDIYNIGSLFLPDVNWRTDLSEILVSAYTAECAELSKTVNENAVEILSGRLNRNTCYLLENEGIVIHIPVNDTFDTISVSYNDLQQYIDKNSALWQNMFIDTETQNKNN